MADCPECPTLREKLRRVISDRNEHRRLLDDLVRLLPEDSTAADLVERMRRKYQAKKK